MWASRVLCPASVAASCAPNPASARPCTYARRQLWKSHGLVYGSSCLNSSRQRGESFRRYRLVALRPRPHERPLQIAS